MTTRDPAIAAEDLARFLRAARGVLTLHQRLGIGTLPDDGSLRRFLRRRPPAEREHARPAPSAKTPPAPRRSLPPESSPDAASGNTLPAIRATLGDCKRCPLHANREHLVFGQGSPEADLLIIAPWPTRADSHAERLVSGPAGELLARMLDAIHLGLDEVYLTALVKCPPTGKPPTADELTTCRPFLTAQIEAVAPKVICPLGPEAAQALLAVNTPLHRLRGRWHRWHGYRVMPTYHPAFLLQHSDMKAATWIDLQKIQQALKA